MGQRTVEVHETENKGKEKDKPNQFKLQSPAALCTRHPQIPKKCSAARDSKFKPILPHENRREKQNGKIKY